MRICLEFGSDAKKTEYREQVRFVCESGSEFGPAEIAKSFASSNAQTPYRFCALPHDDQILQKSNTGYKVTRGKFDRSGRNAVVEFERGFSTGVTNALVLKGGETMKAWIQWGIWDDKNGISVRRNFGNRDIEKGLDFTIQKPPVSSFLNAVSLSSSVMVISALTAVAF